MLSRGLIVFGVVLIALGAGGYALWHSKDSTTLVGVVRTT